MERDAEMNRDPINAPEAVMAPNDGDLGVVVHSNNNSSASARVHQQQSLLRQQAHSPISSIQRGVNHITMGHQGASYINNNSFRRSTDQNHIPQNRSNLSFMNMPERDADEEIYDSPSPTGWTEVELAQDGGIAPSARSLHAAALLNSTLYVFGGYDGTQRVNTFHAFSFAEKRWSPVLPAANSAPPPSPRDRHVAVSFSNSIYIHGGFDGASRVSDFWAFDFSTMTWREVVALQGRSPSPRHSHSAIVHNHSFWIFGGYVRILLKCNFILKMIDSNVHSLPLSYRTDHTSAIYTSLTLLCLDGRL
jgi:hypothetical protein